MPTEPTPQQPTSEPTAPGTASTARQLTPAAARALAEAAARRAERDRDQAAPRESGGRGGLDPVRYGDWEVNGLSSDF